MMLTIILLTDKPMGADAARRHGGEMAGCQVFR
jgi:hypothetical protein